MIAKKNASDEQWKTQRQAERDNATDMQDMGVARIVSLPEAYAKYLEVQGDNPYYSPGNIALAMLSDLFPGVLRQGVYPGPGL